MGAKFITSSSVKATAFLAVLLALSIGLKFSFPVPILSNQVSALAATGVRNGRTFLFIGTSRTRGSVATPLLETERTDDSFVNLGLSSSSFLYNCEIASKLLKVPGKKVVFIELAGLAILPPDDSYRLLTVQDVHSVMAQHLSVRRTSVDLVELMYYCLNIREDLKRIFYQQPSGTGSLPDGREVSRELWKGTPAIPAAQALKNLPVLSPEVMNLYKNSINKVMTLAEGTGSEIIFMMPVAIPTEDELQIDIPVFSWLPENNKWQYTSDFLRSIDDRKYFADESHLNQAGARVYTLELQKFIQQRF